MSDVDPKAAAREQKLAEVGALTDEQVGARIIDSITTQANVTGMLGVLSRWVRDVREAERRKAQKGAAVSGGLEPE